MQKYDAAKNRVAVASTSASLGAGRAAAGRALSRPTPIAMPANTASDAMAMVL